MATYTFKWEDANAEEVIITGLFDDWAKTIKMEGKSGFFSKTVRIPAEHIEEGKKIYYKFVVDGNWVTRDDARGEYYGSFYDNFLLPEDLTTDPAHSTTTPSTISSVAPGASTTTMAGEVPKEPRLQEEKDVPGSFPETPGATPAGEAQTFSVNPIPASEGVGNPIHLAAGEPVPDPSTFNSNTIASTVEDGVTSQPDAEADTFSVAPIPATAGIGNPVTLAPGEKVPDPSTLTSNTVQSTVEDATPEPEAEKTFSVAPIPATAGIGNPITLAPNEAVPDPSTLTSNTIESTVEDDAKADTLPQENGKPSNGSAMFGVPPVTSTLIPESSLPMGGGDAAEDVVAGPFISSAGAGTTTADLAGQVPKEPRAAPSDPTIQSVAPESTTAALAAEVPKETREAPADPTISSAGAGTTTAALAAEVPKETAEVPEIVSESQAAADAAPEASASAQAVTDKSAVEAELLKEVEPAPAAAESGSAPSSDAVVPDEVKESIAKADAPAEATTNPVAVTEKAAVEEELKKAVPEENSKGEPAPTTTASTSATAPGDGATATTDKEFNASKDSPAQTPATAGAAAAAVSVPSGPADSRDQSTPAVTTGATTTSASTKTEAGPVTPKKDAPSKASESETTASKKKKNRLSGFFHKIEEKIKGHKEK